MEYNEDRSVERNQVEALISIANSLEKLEKLPARMDDMKHTMENMKVMTK